MGGYGTTAGCGLQWFFRANRNSLWRALNNPPKSWKCVELAEECPAQVPQSCFPRARCFRTSLQSLPLLERNPSFLISLQQFGNGKRQVRGDVCFLSVLFRLMWLLDTSAHCMPEDLRIVFAGGCSTTVAFVLGVQREGRNWRCRQAESRILVRKLSFLKSRIGWDGVEMG